MFFTIIHIPPVVLPCERVESSIFMATAERKNKHDMLKWVYGEEESWSGIL
jgi:hypothetical protein